MFAEQMMSRAQRLQAEKETITQNHVASQIHLLDPPVSLLRGRRTRRPPKRALRAERVHRRSPGADGI